MAKLEGIGSATSSRCVHCLEHLREKTADHIVPSSWYPEGTPDNVQRWSVPSCLRCNKRLGAAEKDLLVTMALCINDLDACGMPSGTLRAIGFGTSGLTEKEQSHRQMYRRKILSQVVPYDTVKDRIPAFPGTERMGHAVANTEPVVLLTLDMITPVAEKIVRGLEFKLTGRYVEPPLSLKTFVVPQEKTDDLDDIFERATQLEFGPGISVLRAVPIDIEIIAMYRIVIWTTLTVHVAVSRLSH